MRKGNTGGKGGGEVVEEECEFFLQIPPDVVTTIEEFIYIKVSVQDHSGVENLRNYRIIDGVDEKTRLCAQRIDI